MLLKTFPTVFKNSTNLAIFKCFFDLLDLSIKKKNSAIIEETIVILAPKINQSSYLWESKVAY